MVSSKVTSTALLDSLITPATLAERLEVAVRTLSEWRINGSGPQYIRLGKSVRYSPEAVDNWLLSQVHTGTVEEARP